LRGYWTLGNWTGPLIFDSSLEIAHFFLPTVPLLPPPNGLRIKSLPGKKYRFLSRCRVLPLEGLSIPVNRGKTLIEKGFEIPRRDDITFPNNDNRLTNKNNKLKIKNNKLTNKNNTLEIKNNRLTNNDNTLRIKNNRLTNNDNTLKAKNNKLINNDNTLTTTRNKMIRRSETWKCGILAYGILAWPLFTHLLRIS
jgi:hypothetical protein